MDLINVHKSVLGAAKKAELVLRSTPVCRLRFRLSSGWESRPEDMSCQPLVNNGHKVTPSRWTDPESHSRSRALRRECGTGWGDCEHIILKKNFLLWVWWNTEATCPERVWSAVSEDIKNLSGHGPDQPAVIHTPQARKLDKATCRGLFQTQLFSDFVNIKESAFFASEREVFKHFPTNKSLNQSKWTIILL